MSLSGNDNKYGYTTTYTFDAVIVANGHYSQPHFPKIQGSESFPGKIMHSIDFDKPVYLRTSTCLFLGLRPPAPILLCKLSISLQKFLSAC